MNGVYEPTLELCCGLPAFQKKSDKDLWLEYFNSKWRILGTAGRGTNSGWAFISAERPCLPQDCNMGEWQVAVGSKHKSFPAVTIFALAVEEYFVPIALLIRRGVINIFVARNIIFSIFGLHPVVSDVLNSILFHYDL